MPTIFLTAFDLNASRKQAKEGEAAAFFRKPVDDQALLDAVKWTVKSSSS